MVYDFHMSSASLRLIVKKEVIGLTVLFLLLSQSGVKCLAAPSLIDSSVQEQRKGDEGIISSPDGGLNDGSAGGGNGWISSEEYKIGKNKRF